MISQVFKTKAGEDDPWGFSSDDERKEHIPDLLIKYWEIVIDVFDDEYSDLDKIPSLMVMSLEVKEILKHLSINF